MSGHVCLSRYLKSQSAVVLSAIFLSLCIFTFPVNAAEMRVTVQGEIYNSADPADILGYGGTGGADGTRVTIQFFFDTNRMPQDWYGGARFPREADYFSYGGSSTAPSWVSSQITFDNGVSLSSDDYEGALSTTDQVKIIERNGGAPYDYIGFHDSAYDASGGFALGAVVYDSYQDFVDGLSPGQSVTWARDAVYSPYLPRGTYRFLDYTTGSFFQGEINIDSLVMSVQTIEIGIDIKPGSDPNCFNANGHGVIPVAVLGSDTFDVTLIDQNTLSFGGLDVRIRGKKGPLCGLEDTNLDEFYDLVCHFEDNSDYWEAGNDDATLTGKLLDGTEIEGTGSICIVP